MKRSWWRTGPPIKHTQPVLRPTAGQLLRQGIVLLAIAALWGGILLVLLGATRSSNVAFVAERGTPLPKAAGTVVANKTPTMAPAAPAPAASATVTRVTADAVTASTTATPAATGIVTASVSFARDVLPIFTQICVKCHGGEKTNKSLVLKTYDDLMQGSEDGPVVEPGDPRNSLLIDMIVKGKMPKNGPKLLPKQIQLIVDWVTAGAPNN